MATKKSAASRKRVKSLIDIPAVVRIQQNCVGRVIDFWANAATRVSHGNFDVTQWAQEYSLLADESLDDYTRLLKAVFGRKR